MIHSFEATHDTNEPNDNSPQSIKNHSKHRARVLRNFESHSIEDHDTEPQQHIHFPSAIKKQVSHCVGRRVQRRTLDFDAESFAEAGYLDQSPKHQGAEHNPHHAFKPDHLSNGHAVSFQDLFLVAEGEALEKQGHEQKHYSQ